VLLVHTVELGQSASVLHCTHPAVASHTWAVAVQSVAVPATQVWVASQVLAGVNTVPLHDAGAQSSADSHATQPAVVSHRGVASAHDVCAPAVHVFAVQLGAATKIVPVQEEVPVQSLAT
jgi:hypothetical protein